MGINLTKSFFSTSNRLITILSVIVIAQQLFIFQKSHTIDELEAENTTLKDDIYSIQDQISDLENSATDIKMFQNEMVKILKSINHSYPMKFITEQNEQAKGKRLSLREQIKNAYKNAISLSSSQRNLHFENANLLADAIFIKTMLLETPTLYPVNNGRISSHFGDRVDPITKKKIKPHYGLDIVAPVGTPVLAAAHGKVIKAGFMRDLGNYVDIEHANGFATRYGHLKKYNVKPGDEVKQGQQIAQVGKTGSRCTGAHVHLEITRFGVKMNPELLLISSQSRFF